MRCIVSSKKIEQSKVDYQRVSLRSDRWFGRASDVQRVDNVVQQANNCPLDNFCQKLLSYLMESAIQLRFKLLSIIQLLSKPTMDGAIHPLNNWDQGPVSRTSRELFGPEKLVVKLQSARFEKLIFSHAFNMRKGLFRVTKFPLYLGNAEGLTHQTAQSYWFLLH